MSRGGCEKGDGSIEVDGGLSSVSCKAAESEGQALLSGQQYKKPQPDILLPFSIYGRTSVVILPQSRLT